MSDENTAYQNKKLDCEGMSFIEDILPCLVRSSPDGDHTMYSVTLIRDSYTDQTYFAGKTVMEAVERAWRYENKIFDSTAPWFYSE